jgi:hypothetical protein
VDGESLDGESRVERTNALQNLRDKGIILVVKRSIDQLARMREDLCLCCRHINRVSVVGVGLEEDDRVEQQTAAHFDCICIFVL